MIQKICIISLIFIVFKFIKEFEIKFHLLKNKFFLYFVLFKIMKFENIKGE